MYLDYQTYKNMGGTLDNSAFTTAERKAEYLVNSQAGGKTGERLSKFSTLPQAVKDCVFELVNHLANYDGKTIASESQSLGGQSESVSYVTMSVQEAQEAALDIIYMYLYPLKLNGVSVLYGGAKNA